MGKLLKDQIFNILEDASMKGINAVQIIDPWYTPSKVIATIPIIPESVGAFIASQSMSEYQKLLPYQDCEIVDRFVVDSGSSMFCQKALFVTLKIAHDKPASHDTQEAEPSEPQVNTIQHGESVKLVHDSNASFFMSTTKIRDELRNIIEGCRKDPYCQGIHIRSVNTMRELGSFYIPTDDMDLEAIEEYRSKAQEFLRVYGDMKICIERSIKLPETTTPRNMFEVFIDDYDYQFAEKANLDGVISTRYRVIDFMLKNMGKTNALQSCASMTLIMKNTDGALMDCAELTF